MVRYAVGYQSRAFVTFGTPIPIAGLRSRVAARRDGPRARDPRRDRAALQGAADRGRRRRDASVDDAARARAARRAPSSTCCGRRTRTSACRAAARRSRSARRPLADRNIIYVERGGRFRVRERTVLRYYARTHPTPARPAAHRPHPLMIRHRLEGFFPHSRRQPEPEAHRVPLRHARRAQLRPPVHRRRDRRRSHRRRARARRRPACT